VQGSYVQLGEDLPSQGSGAAQQHLHTNAKRQRIGCFGPYGEMLNQEKLLTREARSSGDGSWAKRLNHSFGPNHPKRRRERLEAGKAP